LKTVVVSQRAIGLPERPEIYDGVDRALSRYLVSLGLLPVPVPNGLDPAGGSEMFHLWLKSVQPSGFILSGGGDVTNDEARNAVEDGLLNLAELHQMPVLGICRGAQKLAVRAGGTLTREENHVGVSTILISEFDFAPGACFHDFAIEGTPEGYATIAQTEEGRTEAFQHRSLPWVGVMWHPERQRVSDPKLLEYLHQTFHGESP